MCSPVEVKYALCKEKICPHILPIEKSHYSILLAKSKFLMLPF